MSATATLTQASVVEWDILGARTPSRIVGELARRARVVEPSLALFLRSTVGDLPTVETLILEADTSLGVAALAAATRAAEFSHDEVVVRLADGAFGILPVAELFAELALARSFSALHDPLTGLPNRAFLLARLAQVQARLPSDAHALAVLFVDVDEFKSVNDSYGHESGDALLIAVGVRLRATLRPGDFLARLGGDEFVIVLEGVSGEQEAASIAIRVIRAFPGEGSPVGHRMGVSVGVAVAAEAKTAEALLDNADSAMYAAKRKGGGAYSLYSPELERRAHARQTLCDELRRAVEEQQFTVFYQPIIELDGLRMVSIEALVRWQHPSRGTLSPAEFIPIAEEIGLLEAIDRWVLGQALRQVGAWRLAYSKLQGLTASVNVSPLELARPGFPERVLRALADASLPPPALTLEITEGVFVEQDGAASQACCELARCGVRLALDDFGTGYSSLAYLQRLPIDCLKIDREFVSAPRPTDGLLQGILELARGMGLATIAEGIETAQQLAGLREGGCLMGQGYLFSRPVPPAAIPALLDHGSIVPAHGEARAQEPGIAGGASSTMR